MADTPFASGNAFGDGYYDEDGVHQPPGVEEKPPRRMSFVPVLFVLAGAAAFSLGWFARPVETNFAQVLLDRDLAGCETLAVADTTGTKEGLDEAQTSLQKHADDLGDEIEFGRIQLEDGEYRLLAIVTTCREPVPVAPGA